MTEKLQFYRCNVCGNVVQVVLYGEGELVCCGQSMQLLHPNTREGVNLEYHIPVYKYTNQDGMIIQVGKEEHPMTQEHHIMFIETVSEDEKQVKLQYLEAEEEPIMQIEESETKGGKALAYCNLHGLWEGKNE